MHARHTRQHIGGRTEVGETRLKSIFESGLPFSKKLTGHRSCINAVTFSRGEGRWLASAGDDLHVKLWDFHQETLTSASGSLDGHLANIFCLDFSTNNQYLFSGGLDETVIQHDVAVGTRVSSALPNQRRICINHESTIRGLTCSPENENVLLTASESGRITLCDFRTSNGSPLGSVEHDKEFTDVKYHPQSDKLFVSSDCRGNVCLRDARMAFGANSRGTAGGTVLKYVTGITRRSVSKIVKPEASSVTFDREGKKLAVINQHHSPTIYSTADPYPLAVCSSRKLHGELVPSGERTYRNSCTTKHGSFGGPGLPYDDYFATGSDDFRAYVWKVPDLAELEQRRRKVRFDEWMTEEPPSTIGYAVRMEDDRLIPVDLDEPLFRLLGHRSIVNSCIFHPHLPQIVTSGVERHLTVHSPTHVAPNMELVPTDLNVRRLPDRTPELSSRYSRYIQALFEGPGLEEGQEASEEQRTIDFFDGVIREHEDINVFTSGFTEDDSDEDMTSE